MKLGGISLKVWCFGLTLMVFMTQVPFNRLIVNQKLHRQYQNISQIFAFIACSEYFLIIFL